MIQQTILSHWISPILGDLEEWICLDSLTHQIFNANCVPDAVLAVDDRTQYKKSFLLDRTLR